MSKQPELILEEQLVEQLQKLNYGLVLIRDEKELIKQMHCQSTVKKFKEMLTESKNSITFAPTVLATHKPARVAYQGESFAFIGFYHRNNTPPMPLLIQLECTLRGFFH
jgi:hypothetical protein